MSNLTFEKIVETSDLRGVLEIQRSDGSLATYRSTVNAMLKDRLQERWVGIGSDGTAKFVEEEFSPGRIVERLERTGGYTARIVYKPALDPGPQVFRAVTEYRDAFTKESEYYTINISFPMRLVEIQVVFPSGSLVTSASVIRLDPTETPTVRRVIEDAPKLTLNDSQYVIAWMKENPKLHSEYRIEWSWQPVSHGDEETQEVKVRQIA